MVVILGLWFVHDGGDGGKVYFTGGKVYWRRLDCRLGLAAFGLSARTGGVWIVGSDWRLVRVDLDWRLQRVENGVTEEEFENVERRMKHSRSVSQLAASPARI
jgi:hypothetical protein